MNKRNSKVTSFDAVPRSSRADGSVYFSDAEDDYEEYTKDMDREAHGSPSTNSAVPKLSPSLAAAMLSLPWPPENTKVTGADENSDDFDFKTKKMTSGAKSSISTKLRGKKKSRSSNKADQQTGTGPQEREYRPFTIPKFQDVHTNWPGFDHEPIPNWQEKYMIAKPYPKSEYPSPDPQSYSVLSKPSNTANNNEPAATKLSDEDEDDEEEANDENKNSSLKQRRSKTEGTKPRQRLFIERVGSCVR